MTTADIDRALAALTPQQRAAFKAQHMMAWLLGTDGGEQDFETWLRRAVTRALNMAEIRLKELGY